jgi:hypothetical protein
MGKIRTIINKWHCHRKGHSTDPLIIGIPDSGYIDLVVMCQKCHKSVFIKRVHMTDCQPHNLLTFNGELGKLVGSLNPKTVFKDNIDYWGTLDYESLKWQRQR